MLLSLLSLLLFFMLLLLLLTVVNPTCLLNFSAALKHVVRQAPDVIMVGEMRDRETVEATLQAAETGHLVFSTLHTVNAVQTVERIIAYFPPHQHNLIRQQLAMTLEGVISLRLIQKKDAFGRVPAVELPRGGQSPPCAAPRAAARPCGGRRRARRLHPRTWHRPLGMTAPG